MQHIVFFCLSYIETKKPKTLTRCRCCAANKIFACPAQPLCTSMYVQYLNILSPFSVLFTARTVCTAESLLPLYTVPKVIDFPRYNMKFSGENVILRGIFHVVRVSRFPLQFTLYRGNLDYFVDSVDSM